jgi:hypothetical protein
MWSTSSSDSVCKACNAGSITNKGANTGASACMVCVAGKYSNQSDVAACTNCLPGMYSSSGIAFRCKDLPCPVGDRIACGGAFEGYCTDCIPGQYPDAAMGACALCPPGRFGEASRSAKNVSDCQLCAPGKVQKDSGKVFCNAALRAAYVRNNEEIECPVSRVQVQPVQTAL